MHNMLRLFSTIILLSILVGCSGKGNVPDTLDSPPSASPVTQDAVGLPSPGNALTVIAARTSSELLVSHYGGDFEAGLSQRVEAEDTGARFSPQWSNSYPYFGNLAFAVYSFNVEGYSGAEEVQLDWSVEPTDYSKLWIALPNWSRNTWEWHAGPADGVLDLNATGFADYIKPGTHQMLVAVVMQGMDDARLDWLQLGNTAPQPITVTAVTPDPAESYSGLDLIFEVQFSGRQDSTATYLWDFNGGATPDNPAVQTPTVTLGDTGTYDCSVTVDNDYGDPDMFSFALNISEAGSGDWAMFGHDAQHTRRSPYVGTLTNNVKWKFRTTGPGFYFGGTIFGPAGEIYTVARNELHVVNPDGSVKWISYHCDSVSGPALATDETIYLGCDDQLNAINPDGSLRWSFTTPGANVYTPIVTTDGTICFGNDNNVVSALNPDGSEKWSFTLPGSITTDLAVSLDGEVFVGVDDDRLVAINSDGTEKWSYSTGISQYSMPVAGADGVVYLGSNESQLIAINPAGSLKWSFPVPGSVSIPAISAAGTIHVGSYFTDGILYAINPAGSLMWSYSTGRHRCSPGINLDGDVFITDTLGVLHSVAADGDLRFTMNNIYLEYGIPKFGIDNSVCLELVGAVLSMLNPDGSEKWSYGAGWNVEASPAIGADGTVYVGSWDGNLYAIKPDGTRRWSFPVGWTTSSPAISTAGTVFIGSSGGTLFAIHPDGSLKWNRSAKEHVRSGPVISDDGTVYVRSDWDNPYLSAFEPDGTLKWDTHSHNGSGSVPAVGHNGTLYLVINRELSAYDADGNLDWSYELGDTTESSPAVDTAGIIYVGCNDNKLYAVNPDGSLKWEFTAGDQLNSSPAIAADGTIYVGSIDTNLYAIDADGTEKWSYSTGSPIWSSPAVDVNGTVYVGSMWPDGKVYAFNPDGSVLWSYQTEGSVESSPAIGADGTVYVGSDDGKLYAFGP